MEGFDYGNRVSADHSAETEAEKLISLRHDLQTGLDDIAAGQVSDGADVFARLKALFLSG
jgi:hypothetical protein